MRLKQRMVDAILGMGSARRDPLLVLYRRQRVWRAPSLRARAGIVLAKPFTAWRLAREFVRTKGRGVQELHGAGPVRQLLMFYWLSMRYSVLPSSSSVYWAFAVRRRRKWDAWLSAPHCTLLLSEIADRSSREIREIISDKSTFGDWAADRGLPAVPIIARFREGRVEGSTPGRVAAALPAADLFAKPTLLTWGVGAARWLHSGNRTWIDSDGSAVTAEDIVTRLCAASATDPFILQRALHAHPSLRTLSPNALCTLRCITYLDASGEPQLIGAGLRLPVGRMIVDNVSSGGMFAGVDPETGRLTRGFRVRPDRLFERTPTGPDGTTRLEGFQVDQWPAAAALALAAQRAAAPIPTVGWDIGLAADGPVLIEANIGWSALTILLPSERPLSETGFPEAMMHWWHATEPVRRPPSAQ
ncbi:MAG TPA: sugar-transfer associated ATP-grasp domain-containing protein [Gemmatimonadales bacterium]|nr:sugar-transfer associated ATP-grasp domain-containing protein [Gemmatimonadales bacterium]